MSEEHKVHPTSKICPIARQKIIAAILMNVPYEMAAHAGRICEKTLYNWINRGIEDRNNNIDSEYARFLQDIKEAEYKKVAAHTQAIEEQSERWQARAWLLERRWRKSFGQDAGIIEELVDKQNRLESLLTKKVEGNSNDNT